MKKILTGVSYTILAIAFINFIAFAALYSNKAKTNNAIIQTFKSFSNYPFTIIKAFREVKSPERLKRVSSKYKPINNLSYDLFACNARYERGDWFIELLNLRNDSVHYQWQINEKDYHRKDSRIFSHVTPRGPIILPDKSLVAHLAGTYNMYKLDSASNIIWHIKDHYFHHAINLDAENNIWAATKVDAFSEKNSLSYEDDHIVKINSETGEILLDKSLSDIFYENGKSYLVHGLANAVKSAGLDPFHLNDIEPTLKDGKYWKKGDLFLSLRHRSMIILYRPSANKILRIIQGPFFVQHDVDILNDSTISLFNNNFSCLHGSAQVAKEDSEFITMPPIHKNLNKAAEVITYNFSDSTFSKMHNEQISTAKIKTFVQGLHHVHSNGDVIIESFAQAKIFIVNEGGLVYAKHINEPVNNLTEPPHWTRFYENLDFLKNGSY